MSRFYKPEIIEIKKKSKSKKKANTNACLTGGGKNTLPSSTKGDSNYCSKGGGAGRGKGRNVCYSGTE